MNVKNWLGSAASCHEMGQANEKQSTLLPMPIISINGKFQNPTARVRCRPNMHTHHLTQTKLQEQATQEVCRDDHESIQWWNETKDGDETENGRCGDPDFHGRLVLRDLSFSCSGTVETNLMTCWFPGFWTTCQSLVSFGQVNEVEGARHTVEAKQMIMLY